MRNSSLVECFCAENLPGLSIIPKLWHQSLDCWVGERSYQRRSYTVRSGGAIRSENVGVSSEKYVRIIFTDRPRFPGPGSSSLGKSGPKTRPKGVADGQQVDIPVLAVSVME